MQDSQLWQSPRIPLGFVMWHVECIVEPEKLKDCKGDIEPPPDNSHNNRCVSWCQEYAHSVHPHTNTVIMVLT